MTAAMEGNKMVSAHQDVVDIARLPMSNWPGEVYPHEPVYGFLQRAATANYAFSTEAFLLSLGLNGLDWDFDEQLEVVNQLPIYGSDELAWNTPRRTTQGYEICGHLLPSRTFSKGRRRVCPLCLEEERYIRIWFDIVPVAACPIHDVRLIEGLDGDPIDWRYPEAGWTQRGVMIGQDHAIPYPATALDRHVFNKVTGVETAEPSHFAGQSLHSVLRAAVVLTKLHRGIESPSHTPCELRNLAQFSFPSLLAGRDAIVKFLAEAKWLQPDSDQTRYHSRCHYAPQLTRTIPTEGLRTLVSDCFGEVRVRSGLATPSGRLSQHDGADGAWTLESVAADLKLESKYLRKILEAAAVSTQRCAHTRAYRLSSDNIDAVRRYIATALSLEHVAAELGCTIDEVDELVSRGTLKMDFRCDGQRYFKEDAIKAFIARAHQGRREGFDPKGMPLASFAAKVGISLPAAYSQLIRNNTIGLIDYDQDAPFFHGARVAYFQKTRLRPGAQIKNAITFAKAKARLGTETDGLAQLVELSYLKIVEDESGRSRICEASLDAFEDAYARAADYAPLLRCSARSALKLLRKKGVEPINEYGKRVVCFVSREQVHSLVGIRLESRTGFQALEVLRDELTEKFASASVPGTARVITDPAIVVEATSRNWSFKVTRKPTLDRYDLVALFRSVNEGGRLRKILAAAVEPEKIWPGAEVRREPGGGFVLVDGVGFGVSPESETSHLVDRIVGRAHELHRYL